MDGEWRLIFPPDADDRAAEATQRRWSEFHTVTKRQIEACLVLAAILLGGELAGRGIVRAETVGDGRTGRCAPHAESSPAGQEFRLFFVPSGDAPADYQDGPTVLAAADHVGGTVTIEMFIQHAPGAVRGIQVDLPCSLNGDGTGSIDYVSDSAQIDTSRSDFVFFGSESGMEIGADNSCAPHLRFVMALESGDHPVDEPRYVGSFELAISSDAEGSFAMEFALPPVGDTTVLDIKSTSYGGLSSPPLIVNVDCMIDADCDDGDACTFDDCTDGICSTVARLFGDVASADGCEPDGVVDLTDINAITDVQNGDFSFRGDFDDPCSEHNFDLMTAQSGCDSDGIIDEHDVNAVIDAYEQNPACCGE